MRKIMLALAAATLFSTMAAAEDRAAVQVMIVGTYHMANPGQDLHNVEAEDVTTPQRQKELEDVAKRLAKFKPSKIAVEGAPESVDFFSEQYRAFTPAALLQDRDERVQIAYRLARKLGHDNIYLIDERSDEIDYFPFGAVQTYAEEAGRAKELEDLFAGIGRFIQEFTESQKNKSVGELIAVHNDPGFIEESHSAYYYGVLSFGGPDKQPGAELNAYWYMRNAKIFAKLMQVAEPGDRIVVVFGSGHNYWLRHFAQTTPGFKLVEANDYLTGEKGE